MLMLTPQSKGAGQLSFFIKYIYLLLKVCLFGWQTLVVVLKPRKKIHKGAWIQKNATETHPVWLCRKLHQVVTWTCLFFCFWFVYCTRPNKWKTTFPLSVNLSHWIGKTASIPYSSLVVLFSILSVKQWYFSQEQNK